MLHIKQLLPVLTISLLVITGCQKEISTNDNAPVAQLESKRSANSSSVPLDFAQNIKQHLNVPSTLNTEPWRKFIQTFNPLESVPCNENTPIRQWMQDELSNWEEEDFQLAYELDLSSRLWGYVYCFETNTASQYFGYNGDFTQQVQKAFKDLRRFWGFQSIEVQLAALHGSTLLESDKIATLLRLGSSDEEARALAEEIADAVKNNPNYRKGNHPYFTFNAYAMFVNDDSPVGPLPYKILMGDGILEGYAALGYGDVAPQAVLAHEFGHIVQFSLEIYANVPDSEVTRWFELMADAYAAYYLSHSRGAAMQWKRVKQFLQVFFNIGDCAVEITGHHGTPAQRMAAAEWAYNLANDAQKQGHILSAKEFVTLFDAALPEILSH